MLHRLDRRRAMTRFTSALNQMRRVLRDEDTGPLAILLGLYMLIWGVALLMPWTTFTAFSVYGPMSQIAPEWVWGLLIVLVGSVQVLAPTQKHRTCMCWVHAIAGTIWTFWALFFLMGSGGVSAAAPGFLVLALGSALCYLRARGPVVNAPRQ